ncbi:hypothetical protein IU469_22065 [Nocardia puris]|uniref:hypothetical protein n=1 Tax=Nocardia puris TaxID=208602 RepID=UPI0018938C96|nr:hypothetical protein [Nocardia puris]MBF6368385.1 hypothetical protein [Nocardia puris]
MILLGHLIQLSYVGILGAIAIGISIHHRPDDPVAADCPFCAAEGCEHCAWSGEIDAAELEHEEEAA